MKYQVNAMMAFLSDANQNFRKIMNDIAKNSSDELTTKLLRLGLDTWDVKLMQLKASIQTFGKSIGDSVLPELKSLTIGLANSVYWLTEHKEQVNQAVGALIELGKILLAYVIQQKSFALQQRVTNALFAEGTVLLRAMYLLEGDWKTAFAGMTGSLVNAGKKVTQRRLGIDPIAGKKTPDIIGG